MTREQVIELIIKMNKLNQREQALATYRLANDTWPEWELKQAFEQLKETNK